MSNRQTPLETRRIALERAVHLRFSRFDDFVTEYSKNISMTGMFVASTSPRKPGTVFSFEASVADDWKLIRGEAQVVWVRPEYENDDRPAGMGVRFIELDPQSRRLIRWLVEKHQQEGGTPFELGPIPGELASAPPATEGSTASPRPSLPSPARPARRGRKGLAIVLALVAVVAAAALLFSRWSPTVERAAPPPAPRAAVQPPTGAAETVPGAGAAPVEKETGESDLISTIRAWAGAWSDQRVDDYLAFYSRDFRPPGGLRRAAWEATRRERLTSPRFIRVAITALETEVLGQDRLRARFFQTYRSDRFEDTIRKSLEMVREDGAWKIVDEQVLGPAE